MANAKKITMDELLSSSEDSFKKVIAGDNFIFRQYCRIFGDGTDTAIFCDDVRADDTLFGDDAGVLVYPSQGDLRSDPDMHKTY